jgi:hypothetical protein
VVAKGIFISHSHADNAVGDWYALALRKEGFDVWYDRMSLDAGQRLSADIQHELETRQVLLAMLSPAALESYWVQLEVDAFRSLAASDSKRILLPILIAPCEMPLLLRVYKWIDATTMPAPNAIQEILHTISSGVVKKPALQMPSISAVKTRWSNLRTKYTAEFTITQSHIVEFQMNPFPLPRLVLTVDGQILQEYEYMQVETIQFTFYVEGLKLIAGYSKFGRGILSLEIAGSRIV